MSDWPTKIGSMLQQRDSTCNRHSFVACFGHARFAMKRRQVSILLFLMFLWLNGVCSCDAFTPNAADLAHFTGEELQVKFSGDFFLSD